MRVCLLANSQMYPHKFYGFEGRRQKEKTIERQIRKWIKCDQKATMKLEKSEGTPEIAH